MTRRAAQSVQTCKVVSFVASALLGVLLLAPGVARSEPYLAVRAGAKCMVCHVNPGGGGKRTDFGSVYGQTALAASRIDLSARQIVPTTDATAGPMPWTGRLGEKFALGADFRATAQAVRVPASASTPTVHQTRAQVYVEVKPVGDQLTLYLDGRVAPGAPITREAYALFWFADQSAYLKAGRMFVPFGLRIEDDSALIRQVSGVNFNASEDGVEGGLEVGPWSASVAVTQGVGGGAQTDRGKLVSAIATYVQPSWRVGASLGTLVNGRTDRRMQSVFGGLRTGIVSWLGAAVYVTENGTPIGRLSQWASLVEGNVELARGHNLKLGYEFHDPNLDVREDQRVRYSVVWEVVPVQFTQLRFGARKNKGIPQNRPQNASEWFAQWHAFF